MQIISPIALYSYKVPVIMKKKFTFCSDKLQETFQIFSRTNKQNSTTFQDSKKHPGLFQEVATL